MERQLMIARRRDTQETRELECDANGGLHAVTAWGAPAPGTYIGDVVVSTALPAGTNTIGATQDAGPAWTSAYQHTASADASAGADATAAPTAGQKIVVDDIIVSVGADLTVTFEEETSGTDIFVLYMAENTVAQITPRTQVKLPTADKKLRIKTSGAGNVACTVCYHSEA
jgi:hypothetical protein